MCGGSSAVVVVVGNGNGNGSDGNREIAGSMV